MKTFLYIFKRTLIAIFFATSVTLMAQIPLPSIALEQPIGGEQWTRGGTYLISWMDNFNGNVDALYKYKYASPSSDHIVNGINSYPETDPLLTKIQEELLSTDYAIADWNDLLTIGDVDAWIIAMGWDLEAEPIYWITKGGIEWDIDNGHPTYHFMVRYYDNGGTPPSGAYFDDIGGKIWLGSYFGISRKILARKTWSDYIAFTPGAGVTGTTTYWDTDGLPLTQYKIKVQSHNAPTMYYDETGEFSLVYQQDGVIELIQPNGGEVWAKGTTHKISWTDNLDEPVKIELYNGTTWSTIKASTTASTWDWPITQDAGTLYKIRISSTVSGATTAPDISAATFTITAGDGEDIEIIQPNDAINPIIWAKNSSHLISWNDNVVEPVNVYLVPTGGSVVPDGLEIGTAVIGSTMIYDFSTTIAGDYFIEVQSSLNPLVRGFGVDFTVGGSLSGTIDVIQPDDITIQWWKKSTQLISWNDNLTENVNVYLVPMGGTVALDGIIIDLDVSGTTTYFDFTGQAAGFYYVEVQSKLDPSILNQGALFEITESSGSEVVVIQPSITGIEWQRGTSHLVSWTDDVIEPVDVWVQIGGVDAVQIGNDVIGSTLIWDISPVQTIASNYTVEVRSSLDATVVGESLNEFAIVGSTGTYITLLQPVGGEVWSANLSYYISWEDDFLEGVNIYLDRVDPAEHNLIKANAIGSTWVWAIPLVTPADDDYSIYIESVNDAAIFGESGAFTIIPFVMLNAYPNPANQSLTLQVNDPTGQQCQVSIYNRFNAEVYSTSVNTGVFNTLNIPTVDFPNGVYFINVTSNTSNVSRKIIINH